MENMSNQQLIEAYKSAIALNLDIEFLHILRQELHERNIFITVKL
ncbi:sporulation histidine kinase inhibitor Sda [Aquibacillus rhizosphaerae]|uniref:Sporulation histidine kinase inhibitor Sda n=1 Tax=Aquibacillus rhizosphaerae TaxID=3051431 RepID=A0ABT7LCG9_9BACI|nr:sporulation histidine kinase inhibitor Sda [Aquibacillus sp. LR5S19]MDL4842256.1 sporulation histidine kinase inhibitor Sda [Aquibacillus sp. LR5S19]